jgi:hypothetical protein
MGRRLERRLETPLGPKHDFLVAAFESTISTGMYPEYTNGMKSVEHCQRASATHAFFVTKRGFFGLWNKSIQVGDVCAVLGSDVPFLLRKEMGRCLDSRMQVVTGKRRQHESHSLYNFRCQAYVHGIMKYEGDIMEANQSGRIRLRDFPLISPFHLISPFPFIDIQTMKVELKQY